MQRILTVLFLSSLALRGWCESGSCVPVFLERDHVHFVAALDGLNVTTNDLGFDKDVGEPKFVLPRLRAMLSEPLELPRLAGRILSRAAQDIPESCPCLFRDLLECPDSAPPRPAPRPSSFGAEPDLAPALRPALQAFLRESDVADQLLETAFRAVPRADMAYAACSVLAGVFSAEDEADTRQALVHMGIPAETVAERIAENLRIDPEPAADRFLSVVERVGMAELLEAARIFQDALTALERAVRPITNWPTRCVSLPTALGVVWIGTTGPDMYGTRALLVVDPGGDDTYKRTCGSANGLEGHRLAAILDLAGVDRFHAEGMLGQGAAVFGVCAVVDCGGNDTYRASYCGQGCGVFGVGMLTDRAGTELYQARGLAQAAGYVGVGCLQDGSGNDLYSAGVYAQGFAGVRGVGLLVDRSGNDRYVAGGVEPDHERHDDRYVALSQGFATGMRPFAGGGVAALVDLRGNDTYESDIYGQGVSYWYSAGFLLDGSGNDTYHCHQYGQGTGIHLSLGLLCDWGGNDTYTGFALVQGSAHDYAVGMLFDHEGNDVYTAEESAQGRAMYNSFGLLLDSSGRDAYLTRQRSTTQGIGHDGHTREYGSLGVLLDAGGPDTYSCGAPAGARVVRPNHGIIYDVADQTK